MTNVESFHFETLDYRLMRLSSERLDGTDEVNESTFMVTPHIWGRNGDDAPPRQLAIVATLEWKSSEAFHTLGVAAMFGVTNIDGGPTPISDADLARAVDTFANDDGAYVVYDFAQRQLRLICAMHEQDMASFETPTALVVPWGDVQRREEPED